MDKTVAQSAHPNLGTYVWTQSEPKSSLALRAGIYGLKARRVLPFPPLACLSVTRRDSTHPFFPVKPTPDPSVGLWFPIYNWIRYQPPMLIRVEFQGILPATFGWSCRGQSTSIPRCPRPFRSHLHQSRPRHLTFTVTGRGRLCSPATLFGQGRLPSSSVVLFHGRERSHPQGARSISRPVCRFDHVTLWWSFSQLTRVQTWCFP
jgi:hypothetical protein